jgi:subtilisin family serine protease
VLIEMKHSSNLEAAVRSATPAVAAPEVGDAVTLAGIAIDAAFTPVALPHPSFTFANFEATAAPRVLQTSTYLVRGDVEEAQYADLARLIDNDRVLGVFADPAIAPCVTCATSLPVGTAATVEGLLCVPALQTKGLDGSGVLVAIVDTGFNLNYLRSRGKASAFNAPLSWTANAASVPGAVAVDHGTMCAFDVQIAAPNCTLIDVVLLLPTTGFTGALSDAVRAYSHLLTNVMPQIANGTFRALVVNNSWAMFHPSWDLPVGNPGNYSHNPNHPFNRIVASLEQAGADIVFAAGNCGAPCPDGRCQGLTTAGINGANAHAQVLSIAGVDTTGARVGYSGQGPGNLMANKPDVATYTHFDGSGVYAADGGTSAAAPVCSGVVAALRTGLPFQAGVPTSSPAALRALVIQNAVPQPTGFNFDFGWGILDGCALAATVPAAAPIAGPPVAAPVAAMAAPAMPAAHRSLGPSPVQS